MLKTILAVIALSTVVATQAQARPLAAKPMRLAGTLACSLEPSIGLVFGSVRRAGCEYIHYDSRGRLMRETYTGIMTRAGFDVGFTSAQTLIWTVSTPGGRSTPDMVARVFNGSSADLTVFAGAGTNTLFADADRIALAPLSASGDVGMALGFGQTDLDLQHGTAGLARAYYPY